MILVLYKQEVTSVDLCKLENFKKYILFFFDPVSKAFSTIIPTLGKICRNFCLATDRTRTTVS